MLLASSALELRAVLNGVAVVASVSDANSEAGEDVGILYIVLGSIVLGSIVVASYVLQGYGLRLPDVVRVVPAMDEASQRVGVLGLGERSESVGAVGPSESAEARILRHSVRHSDEGSVSDHVSGVNFDHALGVYFRVRPP